jgi:hypothetical protein
VRCEDSSKGTGRLPQMGATADADGERRAYLRLMSLMAVAGDGSVECVGDGVPGARATGGGDDTLMSCNEKRSGGVEQFVGQG